MSPCRRNASFRCSHHLAIFHLRIKKVYIYLYVNVYNRQFIQVVQIFSLFYLTHQCFIKLSNFLKDWFVEFQIFLVALASFKEVWKTLLDEAMKAQSSSSLDMSLLSFHLLKLKVSPFVHFQVPSYNQTRLLIVINNKLVAAWQGLIHIPLAWDMQALPTEL